MVKRSVKRRLAAILAADVVGFSRLMEQDEAGTLAGLLQWQSDILEPLMAEHHGRIVKLMGDGVLAEFASAVSVVACAASLQRRMAEANEAAPEGRGLVLRIGVNLGDVIVQGDDLFGDGVNVAARLQELADPGCVLVSGKVYSEAARNLELSFTDLGERMLKNLSAPVRVYRVGEAGAGRAQSGPEAVLQRPAVAILPFLNLSGDAAQDYFADGVTEDLITALSAWRWFPVIARNSTFVYKGRAVDVVQVGKELGARYVLEGSVRRAGNRVRITAQLIEAASAHHIWAQNHDGELDDVFALQDEITRAIVGAIEPQIERAERQRALRKAPENLDAWDLSLKALALIRNCTPTALAEADALLLQALAMDRASSYAQSLLALARWHAALSGMSDDPKRALASTYQAAAEGVALDDNDWLAHALLGIATLWHRGDYEGAIAEAERAISLNPSAALAYVYLGCALTFSGQPEAALPKLHAALKLDPRFQFLSMALADIGLAHYLLGDSAQAAQFCERAIREQRDNVRAWQRLAAARAQLGEAEAAQSALATVLRLQPEFAGPYLKATYPFRDAAHSSLFEDGLKRAGWPG